MLTLFKIRTPNQLQVAKILLLTYVVNSYQIHCVQGELTLFLNDYFCVTNMLKQHIMLF